MKIIPGNIETINNRIAYFQKLHKMSSAEMKRKLDAGEIEETHDICTWLMQLELKRRIENGRNH